MSSGQIAALLMVPLLISGGQLLFKLASQTEGLIKAPALLSLLSNPYFIAAMTIYVLSTIWWIWLLRSVPLGRAYVFMALSFLFVPVLAHWMFGEPLNWRTAASAALIVAGIVVAVSASPDPAGIQTDPGG